MPSRRRIVLGILLGLLLIDLPASAVEPWRVLVETEATSGGERAVASAVNAEGFRLQVAALPGERGAVCELALPPQSTPDGSAAEPLILEVDALPPQRVGRWQPTDHWEDGGDFLEGLRRELGLVPLLDLEPDAVVFQCWRPLPRQTSPTRGALRQMLDGSELVVRLAVDGGGFRETTFALAGARQAITEALGIPPEPTRRDVLQDELLALRIDYRKTTCYLLRGKRRQKRCLEAVERCRSQDQDSVVSMLGCIEGE